MAGTIIRLLGRPGILRTGTAVARPRGRKSWAVLALTALGERPVPRHELIQLLFRDAEDPAAALRWVLSELRRALRPDATIDGDPVTLRLSPDVQIDAGRLLSGGLVTGEPGELLAGLTLPGHPEFELWLDHQRERVTAAWQASMRTAIGGWLGAGRPAAAVGMARSLAGAAPLDERHHLLLVRALMGAGDRHGAEQAVRDCVAVFARELGVRPSPGLTRAVHDPPGDVVLMPDGRRLRARLEIEAGQATIAAGVVGEGLERLRLAVTLAAAVGDPRVEAEANAALGTAIVHSVALTHAGGLAALRRAAALARTAGDRVTGAAATRELAFVAAGIRARPASLLRTARELAGDDDGQLGAVLAVEAMTLADSGRLGAAIRRFRRATTLSEAAGEPRKTIWSLTQLARVSLLGGDPAEAREAIDRADVLLTGERWTTLRPWVLAVAAEIDLHEDLLDEAGEKLTAAWTTAERLADPCWNAIVGRGLGLLAARRGDPGAALRWLDTAYHRVGDPPPVVCRWMDAAIVDTICEVTAGRPGLARRAEAAVGELEALATRYRMRGYSARAQSYRARLGRRSRGHTFSHTGVPQSPG